jgi:alpha-amylase/alpha-mannosidase (GH57 family)
MQNKYICIHGHFYQPPRENAWLETIEQQESSSPFHDWNERINFECYATNAAARILDTENQITDIVNNYSRISFNMGPTLISWLKDADNATYKLILDADKESQKRFSGHGTAIAQVHSHLIMPLANTRDKITQTEWGLRDFEHRFGRKAEGIWLSETAVDTETLETIAQMGVVYTILAPRQAKAIRKIGAETWDTVTTESIDSRIPYLCKLPSGKKIYIFFYNGQVSQGIAFEGLLNNGKAFAQRLLTGFDNNDEPQLIHVATDGESYGHHHRYGEMALADCLNFIEEKSFAHLTNYAEYLEKFPPKFEAQIHENSSWSCVHGIERWRSNCGCNAGGGYGKWQQEWRGPLRFALNWLRDQLLPIFEAQMLLYVQDPWAVRNDYIEVLLDRSDDNVQQFIEKHTTRQLAKREKVHLLRLLEMQRNAILMFTSCGWFFDEISGIENNQILQYACRAISYARQMTNVDLEPEFMYRLSLAPSNIPEIGNGSVNYEKNVKPAHVDLTRVGMHYAASSLFEKYPQRLELFNYVATSEFFDRIEAGNQRLVVGQTVVRSKITHSEKHFSFAVLYLGQINIIGNISTNMEKSLFKEMYDKISLAFREVNLAEVIGIMQTYFGAEKFTIWQLFQEEKQNIIHQITTKNLKTVENSFRKIYEDNYQLMNGLMLSKVSVPEAYRNAVQYVLNSDLQNFFSKESLDIEELQKILSEIKKWNVSLTDVDTFQLAASQRIFSEIQQLNKVGISIKRLRSLIEVVNALNILKIEPNIWKSQNLYFSLKKQYEEGTRAYPNPDWKNTFNELGTLFTVKTA